MEQHQIKLKVSLSTKLLLSVVLLLFTVIGFLNTTTIVILRDDKITYTYQMQATEAQMVAKDFSFITSNALQTLKIVLGSLDPTQSVSTSQKNAIEAILKNQTTLIGIDYRLIPREVGSSVTLANSVNDSEMKRLKVSSAEISISDDVLKTAMPYLLEKQYLFLNLSSLGKPLLGVVLADAGLRDNPAGVPVSIGILSLETLMSEAHASDLTVADASGWVLFDTDPNKFFGKKNISTDPLFDSAKKARQVESGAMQFENESEKYLGSYTKTSLGVFVLARTKWHIALRATYDLTEKFILLALMSIGAAIVFALFFSKSLTSPLNRLYEATKEVAGGKFDLNLKAKSSDEIGVLSSSFNLMSQKIQELIQESMEKVKIEGELAIASTVQQTLFPPPLADGKNYQIHSYYTPASQVGGDWWGYIESPNRLIVMVADATGHGFPSALITAAARSCFSVIERLIAEHPEFANSPRTLLSFANRAVYEAAKGQIMMTFFIGIFDFESKELTYSSAGHNPPWFYQKSGDDFKMKPLMARGQRLGETRENTEFEEKKINVANDDVLFLYTDGVLEGTNLEGTQYGKKRARDVVEKGLKVGVSSAVQSLVKEFMKFNEGKLLDDDVTIAVTQLRGM